MKKGYFLIGTLLVLFCIITCLVITNNISWFDDLIYNTIFSIRNNFFDLFFKIITVFANTTTIIIIVALIGLASVVSYYIYNKYKKENRI